MTAVVHTIGHGTRSAHDLVAALKAADVAGLVDVRRYPGSRRHPHFARGALEALLPPTGIGYEWWGEQLGGRRTSPRGHRSRHGALRAAGFRSYADHMDTPGFRAALQRLENKAREDGIAIMCAETLWWRCHRRMIADALVLDGFEVVHVIDARTRQPHRPHEAMRSDDRRRPVYDAGSLPLP